MVAMKYQQNMEIWAFNVLKKIGTEGPEVHEYAAVTLALTWMHDNLSRTEMVAVMDELVISPHTTYRKRCDQHKPCYDLLLHTWNKPHGHPGDAELLEKMYAIGNPPRPWETGIPYHSSKWDMFISTVPEILALQHRKDMFLLIMDDLRRKGVRSLLDVGCGTGDFTGIWRKRNPIGSFGPIIGVDRDSWAIEVATGRYPDNTYQCVNVVTKTLLDGNDVIYSGGLFDYFDDRLFEIMLRRFRKLDPKYILIGNFNQTSTTKKIMSLLGWDLFCRDRFELAVLGSIVFPKAKVETFSDRTKCQNWLMIEVS